MRMKAIWNGVVLAESDDTVVVEGNRYFPRDSLPAARKINDHIAFWHGLQVTADESTVEQTVTR